MKQKFQAISVVEIAEICGVARSTVSYWIAKKSLPAHRSGKKHMVFVNDLALFLKSERRPLPPMLLQKFGSGKPQSFRPFKRCWEYWANDPHGRMCRDCAVFTKQIRECFTAKRNSNNQCPPDCHKCRYFSEYYEPRLAFIHQIEKPAAVYKDLYLWSGNRAWANLCGIDAGQLIGVGIEEFVHPDSLRMVIGYNKRRHQGDASVPETYNAFFDSEDGRKIKVYLSISPLTRPSGTWLAVAETKD